MRQSVPLLPRRKFRLLPVVIVGVAVLLAVRLGELSFGVELSPAGPAIAAEGAGADAPKPEKSSASAAEPAGGDGDGEPQEEQQTSGFPVDFTPAEVAVLQDLANRRNELLAFEKELESRDRLLNAAEGRLDKRIGELQQLRDSIEILVREYTDQEKADLQSIVKIYESMKPKDAARILEDLEMRILLGIMEAMKERKSAPILAAMGAKRAREITAELARKREIDLSRQANKDKPSG
jgi:flagellar motility protein MotE (MotC chaperone)